MSNHPKRRSRRSSDQDRAIRAFRNAVIVVVALVLFGVVVFRSFLINVERGQIAVLIRKTGLDLQNGEEIAPTPEHKGVQREVLAEGRHWRNPYVWEWEVIDQIVIPDGKLGLLTSLAGDDPPGGGFLAAVDAEGEATTKGIVPGVLKAGRYPINPYLYTLTEADPLTINAGFKGVVTNVAGPMPENRNLLLVDAGTRGVQKATFDPGTLYLNRYEHRVNTLDCRSERFDLSQTGEMGFPSKDGFWVSLDGVIEFRVDPERAAEVYVIYNDVHLNGDLIHEELIHKVILPKARSFCRLEGSNKLGREFIQGATRTQFQNDFEAAMRRECEPLGIEIIQALITRIRPPEQIADPVRQREIAKQQEEQYVQEIAQQESEIQLAIERAMVEQKQAIVQAEQEVIALETQAAREQEVSVLEASSSEEVAQLKLEAAKDEAAAIEARGKAAAEVIGFENEAEAAGWRKAVAAFETDGAQAAGQGYAQFVMYQKLAGAYQQMMVNTADSPIMRVFDSFAAPPVAPVASGGTNRDTSEEEVDVARRK